MGKFEIRIPAKKKKAISEKENPVVRLLQKHTTHWLKSITNQLYL